MDLVLVCFVDFADMELDIDQKIAQCSDQHIHDERLPCATTAVAMAYPFASALVHEKVSLTLTRTHLMVVHGVSAFSAFEELAQRVLEFVTVSQVG